MATNKEIHEYLFKGENLPNSVSVADQDKYLTLLTHKILISERTGAYKDETTLAYLQKKLKGLSWIVTRMMSEKQQALVAVNKGDVNEFTKKFVAVQKESVGKEMDDNLKKQLARAFLEQTKEPKQSKENFNTYDDGKYYDKNKSKNIVEVCYGSDSDKNTQDEFNKFIERFEKMVADVKVLAASDITDADITGFNDLYSPAPQGVDSEKSVSAEQVDRSASVSSNYSEGDTDNESVFSDNSNENVDLLDEKFMSLSQKNLEGGRGSEVISVADTDRDSTLSTDSTGSFHTAVGEAPNSDDGLSFSSAVGRNSGDNSPNTVYTLEGELHFDGNNRHGYSSPVSPKRDSESKNSEAEPTGMSKLISNVKNVVKTFISSIANKVNTLLKSLGFNASKNEKDGSDLSKDFTVDNGVKAVGASTMSSGSNAAKVAQDPSKSAAAAPAPENPRNGPGGP